MSIFKSNNYPVYALLTMFLLCIYSCKLYSQNTVKAEILKAKMSLAGQWQIYMQVKDKIKTPIPPTTYEGNKNSSSYYIYEFFPNGKYEYQHVLQMAVDSFGRNAFAVQLLETGKWILTNNEKKLNLISDSIAPKKVQPYDLTNTQEFNRNAFTSFSIKHTSNTDTVEYIYLRKNFKIR